MYKKAVVIFGIILTSSVLADVKLPAIFGDHMVLQQNKSVPVWGWAEPGEKISVKGSWSSSVKHTKAKKDGTWSVTIKTPKAGDTVTLTVTGNNEIVINDILAGEVWVCSGQSNMEYTPAMLGDEKNLNLVAESKNPSIRLFTVQKKISSKPEDDCVGSWQLCEPDVVKNFSAVGYYYGKKLNETLNVPVGLISSNWGGTPVETWTSYEGLEPFENFSLALEYLKDPETLETKLQQEYKVNLERWEEQIAAVDAGFQAGWSKLETDDANWQTMELPMEWAGTELETYDGIVWFRRIVNLPPSWAKRDLELHLGPIDDIDTLWFNGVKIGSTSVWDKPRVYQIPASVSHVGKNSLVVRVVDTGGGGGFWGKPEDMRIGPVGADIKAYATVAKTWKYKAVPTDHIPPFPYDVTHIDQNSPTALYNAMIAPLIPFRIAGAIWYQGEANCYAPILYRSLFPAMIEDWRNQWGQGDFPFYYVQIAPYEYGPGTASQALREAQMMTLDAAKKVGMAVTMDIGSQYNIHPKDKIDVGDRLARWALTKTYGKKGIVYSGPVYKSMAVEGSKIRVSFDYAKGGLVAKKGGLTDFEIAGADHVFVPAEAVIDGDEVVVSSDHVEKPVAVRYGWSNWVEGSLFNEAGLPASSFRTDDWPLQ